MKTLRRTKRFSRRGFLKGSAATAAVVAATHGGALAQEFKSPEPGKLTPDEVRTLVVFARDLFPHDRLDDSYYERAVKPLEDESAKDGTTRQTLVFGLGWLDSAAKRMAGASFAQIKEEQKRVAVVMRLREDQSAPSGFFEKVYNTTIVSLYNQPEVWPKFGYEGPSSAKGGYLHRGFDDLNWV
jgi:Gluconate 2-dehydrogenase subunit 3/TAT (twin-arginine translocation) pathway signal sequence